MASSPARISSGAVVASASGPEPADGEPQPGLDLGRAGGVEHDVVDAPVGGDGGEAALGDHEQQRAVTPVVRSSRHSVADVGEVAAPVDQTASGRRVDQRGGLGGRRRAPGAGSSPSAGQHLGRGLQRVGEQQQLPDPPGPSNGGIQGRRRRLPSPSSPGGLTSPG